MRLEAELADKRRQLLALEECSDLELVFGRRTGPPKKEEVVMQSEVSQLELWKQPPQKLERRRLKSRLGARPTTAADAETYARRMASYKRKVRSGKRGADGWKAAPGAAAAA